MLAAGLGAGCGGSAPTAAPRSTVAYDPRDSTIACLREEGLPAAEVGPRGIQVGAPASGPLVVFARSVGHAEAQSMEPAAVGAEVIADALLYVRGGSDAELARVEKCLDRRTAKYG